MSWKLSNFMTSRLAQAITAAATTIYVDSDDVDLLPTLGVGDKAKAVIFNATDREIVNITAWNTDGTLTVERGKESTTGTAFAAGTRIVHTPTAEILQAVLDATVQAVYRGTATGTNAITVTGSGSTPTPSDGDEVSFEVAATNTAAVTLSYTNGSTTIGPFDLVKQDRSALRTGELVAGYRAKAVYDSSSGHFVLVQQTSKHYDITHVNTGPLAAGNQLPNGGLDAWSASSFVTSASGTETADNVYVEYDGTIGAFTLSRQDFTLGQTDVPGGPKYFGRWDQSSAGSASSYRRIRMKIPRVGKYALETVIASMYLKADIARNVTAKLIESFGTGGSPSAEVTVVSEVWALTTAWTMFDITSLMTNINGKTLGSGGDDALILELSLPVNTSMTIDFAMGQLEFGSVASKTHSRLPWEWWQGGTGGVYTSMGDFISSLLPGTSGLVVKTSATVTTTRQIAVGSGLTITNPAGSAGDPTVALGTVLTNYVADPLSVAELASITGTFGTAAFTAATAYPPTSLTLTAGLGISGGGDLSANRSFALDFSELTDTAIATGDGLTFMDVSDSNNPKRRTVSSLITDLGLPLLASANTFTANQTISSTNPIFYLDETDGGANQRYWMMYAASGVLNFAVNNDALAAITAWLTVTRSAATPSVAEFQNVDLRLPANPTAQAVNSAGFRGLGTRQFVSGTYTLALGDNGNGIYVSSGTFTITIPPNSSVAFPIMNTVIPIYISNAAGTVTFAEGAGVTLNRSDGVTGSGSRTATANSWIFLSKLDTNQWVISGLYA